MSQSKGIGPLIKNKLFAGVNSQALKISLLQNNFLSFKEGDIIFQTGDKSEYLYLLIDGEIKLKVHYTINSSIVREKGKNDFFGDYELLDNTPRKSSAVANSDCVLYKISQKELIDLISTHKAIKDTISTEKNEYNFNIKNSSYQIVHIPMGIEAEITNAPVPSANLEQPKDPSHEEIKESEKTDDYPVNKFGLSATEPEEEQLPDEKELPLDKDDTDFPDEGIFSAALNGNLSFNDEPSSKEILPNEANGMHDGSDGESIEETSQKEGTTRIAADDETVENSQEVIESFRRLTDETTHSEDSLIHTPPDVDKVEEKQETAGFSGSELDYKKMLFAVKKIHENVELDKTVRSIIEAMFTLFDSQIVRIFLFDKVKSELWSFPFMENADEFKKVNIGEGLLGSSAKDDAIINLINPEYDNRFNLRTDIVENIIAEDMIIFPVHDGNKNLVAIVQMINSGKNGFTKEDEEILSILSSDIGNAIEKSSGKHSLNGDGSINQFEKISDFVINDINTSLELINRYSEFIRHKTEIKEVKQVAGFITEQVHSVLLYSSIVSGYINGKISIKGDILDLDTILNNKLDIIAEYVESRDAKLFKKLEASTKVFLDPDMFYQACFQLIKILCDSMPDGGNIYLISKEEGNIASIEFHNTGDIIENKNKSNIADSFIIPGNDEDLGLSFAIANKIIKDFDGEIKIGSESIKGSSFKISLPVHKVSND